MRKTVIAGNWKMNKTRAEAGALLDEMLPLLTQAKCDVIVAPPFLSLSVALEKVQKTAVLVAAQNCHFAASGAYTGEVSAQMLADLGVNCVIIGHSERRQYFAETDETVNKKIAAALAANLTAIVCVGETKAQREQGVTQQVLETQVKAAFADIEAQSMSSVIIAYEPVWAIGTGLTATAQQAQDACAFIRKTVARMFSAAIAAELTIQYGGSMNAANADELLQMPDIDGGLIGGASLKAADFAAIVAAADRQKA